MVVNCWSKISLCLYVSLLDLDDVNNSEQLFEFSIIAGFTSFLLVPSWAYF